MPDKEQYSSTNIPGKQSDDSIVTGNTVPTDPDTDKPEAPDRVFEFTPDLNIAPIKNPDIEPIEPTVSKPIARPNTPLQEAISRLNIPEPIRKKINPEIPTPIQSARPVIQPLSQSTPQPVSQPAPQPIQQFVPQQAPQPAPQAEMAKEIFVAKPETIPNPENTEPSNVNSPEAQYGNSFDARKRQDEPQPTPEYPFARTTYETKTPPNINAVNINPADNTREVQPTTQNIQPPVQQTEPSIITPPIVQSSIVPPIVQTTPKMPESVIAPSNTQLSTANPPKENIPTPDPVFSTQRTQLSPNQPTNEPIQINNEEKEKALRTYESDIAEAMARKKTSTASIAIAENDRREREKKEAEIRAQQNTGQQAEQASVAQPTTNHSGKKLFFLLASMIFILGGLIAVYMFYEASPVSLPKPVITSNGNDRFMLRGDTKATIAIDGLSAFQILSRIKNEVAKQQPSGSIKEIIFTKNINGQAVKITGPEILEIMDIRAPDIFKRSLTPDWTLGVYVNSSGIKDVYAIFSNSFFQNAFAGMLAWEGVMVDDLKQYLLSNSVSQVSEPINTTSGNISTSTIVTASSTRISTITPQNTSIRGHFIDGLVGNKDVREYRSDNGSVILLYSFIDSQRMVITSRESTLSEIISRLERQSYIR